MVRETRHLWVGNLPDTISEERIRDYFKRYGPVHSVKLSSSGSNDGISATVSFIDICSAAKAHKTDHRIDERPLKTTYYEPSVLPSVVTSLRDQAHSHYQSSSPASNSHGCRSPRYSSINEEHNSYDRSSHFYDTRRDESLNYNGPGTPIGSTVQGTLRRREYPSDRDTEFSSTTRNRLRSYPHRSRYITNGRPEVGEYRWSSSQYRYHPDGYVEDKLRRGTQGVSPPPPRPVSRTVRQSIPSKKRRHPKSRTGSGSPISSRSSRSNSSSSSSPSSRSPSCSRSGSLGRISRTNSQSPLRNASQSISILPILSPPPEKKCPLAVSVKNLPLWSTESSLREGLFHDYKKHGVITAIRFFGSGSDRYAVICFKNAEGAEKALLASKDKQFFGVKIQVSSHEGLDLDEYEERSCDPNIDEFDPKATRTLFIGGLDKDVTAGELRKHFDVFGDIIEIDIRKQSCTTPSTTFAFCQYPDIKSVVQAIRKMNGEKLTSGGNRIKLGFGKSQTNRCIWVGGLAEGISETLLCDTFKRFGSITHRSINRQKGHALIAFENERQASSAISEMRGFSLEGSRVQLDYASRECQVAFYEIMNKIAQSPLSLPEKSCPKIDLVEKIERNRKEDSSSDRQSSRRSKNKTGNDHKKHSKFDTCSDKDITSNHDPKSDHISSISLPPSPPPSSTPILHNTQVVKMKSFSPMPLSPRSTHSLNKDLDSSLAVRPVEDSDIKKVTNHKAVSDHDSFHSQSPPVRKKKLHSSRSPALSTASPSREVTVLNTNDPKKIKKHPTPSDLKDIVVKISDTRKPKSPSCKQKCRAPSLIESCDITDSSGPIQTKLESSDPRINRSFENISSCDEKSVDGERQNSGRRSSKHDLTEKLLNTSFESKSRESKHREPESKSREINFIKPDFNRRSERHVSRRDSYREDGPPQDPRRRRNNSVHSDDNWRSRDSASISRNVCDTEASIVDISPPGTPVRDEKCEVPESTDKRNIHFYKEKRVPMNLPLPRFALALRSHLSPRNTCLSPKSFNLKSPTFTQNTSLIITNISSQTNTTLSNVTPHHNSQILNSVHSEVDIHDTPASPGQHDHTSDGDDNPAVGDLYQRLRALEERYEKWTGVARCLGKSSSSSVENVTSENAPAGIISLRKKPLKDLDELRSQQPSDIMKSMLSKRSIFDEDSERLENVSDKYEPKPFCSVPRPKSSILKLSNGSSLSSSFPTFSSSTTIPVPSATPLSSLPGIRRYSVSNSFTSKSEHIVPLTISVTTATTPTSSDRSHRYSHVESWLEKNMMSPILGTENIAKLTSPLGSSKYLTSPISGPRSSTAEHSSSVVSGQSHSIKPHSRRSSTSSLSSPDPLSLICKVENVNQAKDDSIICEPDTETKPSLNDFSNINKILTDDKLLHGIPSTDEKLVTLKKGNQETENLLFKPSDNENKSSNQDKKKTYNLIRRSRHSREEFVIDTPILAKTEIDDKLSIPKDASSKKRLSFCSDESPSEGMKYDASSHLEHLDLEESKDSTVHDLKEVKLSESKTVHINKESKPSIRIDNFSGKEKSPIHLEKSESKILEKPISFDRREVKSEETHTQCTKSVDKKNFSDEVKSSVHREVSSVESVSGSKETKLNLHSENEGSSLEKDQKLNITKKETVKPLESHRKRVKLEMGEIPNSDTVQKGKESFESKIDPDNHSIDSKISTNHSREKSDHKLGVELKNESHSSRTKDRTIHDKRIDVSSHRSHSVHHELKDETKKKDTALDSKVIKTEIKEERKELEHRRKSVDKNVDHKHNHRSEHSKIKLERDKIKSEKDIKSEVKLEREERVHEKKHLKDLKEETLYKSDESKMNVEKHKLKKEKERSREKEKHRSHHEKKKERSKDKCHDKSRDRHRHDRSKMEKVKRSSVKNIHEEKIKQSDDKHKHIERSSSKHGRERDRSRHSEERRHSEKHGAKKHRKLSASLSVISSPSEHNSFHNDNKEKLKTSHKNAKVKQTDSKPSIKHDVKSKDIFTKVQELQKETKSRSLVRKVIASKAKSGICGMDSEASSSEEERNSTVQPGKRNKRTTSSGSRKGILKSKVFTDSEGESDSDGHSKKQKKPSYFDVTIYDGNMYDKVKARREHSVQVKHEDDLKHDQVKQKLIQSRMNKNKSAFNSAIFSDTDESDTELKRKRSNTRISSSSDEEFVVKSKLFSEEEVTASKILSSKVSPKSPDQNKVQTIDVVSSSSSDSDSDILGDKALIKIESDSELSDTSTRKPPRPALSVGGSRVHDPISKLLPKAPLFEDIKSEEENELELISEEIRKMTPGETEPLTSSCIQVSRAEVNHSPTKDRREVRMKAIFGLMSDDSDSSTVPSGKLPVSSAELISATSFRKESTSSGVSVETHSMTPPNSSSLFEKEEEFSPGTPDFILQKRHDCELKSLVLKKSAKDDLLNPIWRESRTHVTQESGCDNSRTASDSGKGSSGVSTSSSSSGSSAEELLLLESGSNLPFKNVLEKSNERSVYGNVNEVNSKKDKKKKKKQKEKILKIFHRRSQSRESRNSYLHSNSEKSHNKENKCDVIDEIEEYIPSKLEVQENGDEQSDDIMVVEPETDAKSTPVISEKFILSTNLDTPFIDLNAQDDADEKDKLNKAEVSVDKMSEKDITSDDKLIVVEALPASETPFKETSVKNSRANISQQETLNAVAGLLACYNDDEPEQIIPEIPEETIIDSPEVPEETIVESPEIPEETVIEESPPKSQECAVELEVLEETIVKLPKLQEEAETKILKHIANELSKPHQEESKAQEEIITDLLELMKNTVVEATQISTENIKELSEICKNISVESPKEPDTVESAKSVDEKHLTTHRIDDEVDNKEGELKKVEDCEKEVEFISENKPNSLVEMVDKLAEANIIEELNRPPSPYLQNFETDKLKIEELHSKRPSSNKEIPHAVSVSQDTVQSCDKSLTNEIDLKAPLNEELVEKAKNVEDKPETENNTENEIQLKIEENIQTNEDQFSNAEKMFLEIAGNVTSKKLETPKIVTIEKTQVESSPEFNVSATGLGLKSVHSAEMNFDSSLDKTVPFTNNLSSEIDRVSSPQLNHSISPEFKDTESLHIDLVKKETFSLQENSALKAPSVADLNVLTPPGSDSNQEFVTPVQEDTPVHSEPTPAPESVDSDIVALRNRVEELKSELRESKTEFEIKSHSIKTEIGDENLSTKMGGEMVKACKAEIKPEVTSEIVQDKLDILKKSDSISINTETTVKRSWDIEFEEPKITATFVRGRARGRGRRGWQRVTNVISSTLLTRSSAVVITRRGRGRGQLSELPTSDQLRRSTRMKRARKHPDMVEHDDVTNRRRRGAKVAKMMTERKLNQRSDIYDFNESDDTSELFPANKKARKEQVKTPSPCRSEESAKSTDILSPESSVRKSRRLREKVGEEEVLPDVTMSDLSETAPSITRTRGRTRKDIESEEPSPRKSLRFKVSQSLPNVEITKEQSTAVIQSQVETTETCKPSIVVSVANSSPQTRPLIAKGSSPAMPSPIQSGDSSQQIVATSAVSVANSSLQTRPLIAKGSSPAMPSPIQIVAISAVTVANSSPQTRPLIAKGSSPAMPSPIQSGASSQVVANSSPQTRPLIAKGSSPAMPYPIQSGVSSQQIVATSAVSVANLSPQARPLIAKSNSPAMPSPIQSGASSQQIVATSVAVPPKTIIIPCPHKLQITTNSISTSTPTSLVQSSTLVPVVISANNGQPIKLAAIQTIKSTIHNNTTVNSSTVSSPVVSVTALASNPSRENIIRPLAITKISTSPAVSVVNISAAKDLPKPLVTLESHSAPNSAFKLVSNISRREGNPTPLVDPVTGHLTPMKIGEEGQYVPMPEKLSITKEKGQPAKVLRAVLPSNITVTTLTGSAAKPTVPIPYPNTPASITATRTLGLTLPKGVAVTSLQRGSEVSVELVSRPRSNNPLSNPSSVLIPQKPNLTLVSRSQLTSRSASPHTSTSHTPPVTISSVVTISTPNKLLTSSNILTQKTPVTRASIIGQVKSAIPVKIQGSLTKVSAQPNMSVQSIILSSTTLKQDHSRSNLSSQLAPSGPISTVSVSRIPASKVPHGGVASRYSDLPQRFTETPVVEVARISSGSPAANLPPISHKNEESAGQQYEYSNAARPRFPVRTKSHPQIVKTGALSSSQAGKVIHQAPLKISNQTSKPGVILTNSMKLPINQYYEKKPVSAPPTSSHEFFANERKAPNSAPPVPPAQAREEHMHFNKLKPQLSQQISSIHPVPHSAPQTSHQPLPLQVSHQPLQPESSRPHLIIPAAQEIFYDLSRKSGTPQGHPVVPQAAGTPDHFLTSPPLHTPPSNHTTPTPPPAHHHIQREPNAMNALQYHRQPYLIADNNRPIYGPDKPPSVPIDLKLCDLEEGVGRPPNVITPHTITSPHLPSPSSHSDRTTDSPQVTMMYNRRYGTYEPSPYPGEQDPLPRSPLPSYIAVPSGEAHRAQYPTQISSQHPENLQYLLQNYPVMWDGFLGLKNDQALVRMHFVSGNMAVARGALPEEAATHIRISQRMRLEQSQLEGVAKKMQMKGEHCILIALPYGRSPYDLLQQQLSLETGLIKYLGEEKKAAGIVNVHGPGTAQSAYVIHIFPPCEFANDSLYRIAPELHGIAASSSRLLIVIATC